MVELKGTEKQIKWANDIRDKSISTLNKKMNEKIKSNELFFKKEGKNHPIIMLRIEKIKNIIDEIKTIDNSAWFINELRYLNDEVDAIIDRVEYCK